MKTKIELTEEQISKLMATEEKQLRAKFDKDLAALRKKFQFAEVEFKTAGVKQIEKSKLTEELFKKYLSENKTLSQIAEETHYNRAYLYKLAKKYQTENLSEK
jgi:YesN/AraC family two-component response regulator